MAPSAVKKMRQGDVPVDFAGSAAYHFRIMFETHNNHLVSEWIA
jgi:hypothetical protein